jgi:hypothetical protein
VTTPVILIAINTVGTSSAEAFTFSTVINNGDLIPRACHQLTHLTFVDSYDVQVGLR